MRWSRVAGSRPLAGRIEAWIQGLAIGKLFADCLMALGSLGSAKGLSATPKFTSGHLFVLTDQGWTVDKNLLRPDREPTTRV